MAKTKKNISLIVKEIIKENEFEKYQIIGVKNNFTLFKVDKKTELSVRLMVDTSKDFAAFKKEAKKLIKKED